LGLGWVLGSWFGMDWIFGLMRILEFFEVFGFKCEEEIFILEDVYFACC
jgi:hypothetical protein